MRKIILLGAITLVATSCATTGSGIRTMSYEEASAFENLLIARGRQTIDPPARIFTQPANKTEPCKLPTSQDQLERKNFRAYWDGECKDGFAYGLGRDIAISDTHHLEEITIHDGNGEFDSNRPWAGYDFVNNQVHYGVRDGKYPATSGMNQIIKNDPASFTITSFFGLTDESGNYLALITSPFDPRKIYLNNQGNVGYRLTEFADSPTASDQPLRGIEIVDSKTGVAGGVRIVQFKNGTVHHQKLGIDGQVTEHAAIPQEYVNHLLSQIAEIQQAITVANVSVQKAQQMEREYLYMACNGKHTIKGLDNTTATKICTWRDQFKEPYERALANYQQQVEKHRQQASAREQQLIQQRMYQAQLAQQQAIANQQAWQNINNSLQSTANQINQINQQTQNFMNFQAPQVQPITPSGGNRVICSTLSNGTVVCR